jgi:hypothetical protein
VHVVDGNGGKRGQRQTELLEVRVQILRPVSPTQLDEGNALSSAVDARGEVIEVGDLSGCMRFRSGSGVPGQAPLGSQMSSCLGAVIKSQNALYDRSERSGEMNGSGMAAIGAGGMSIMPEVHPKGSAKVGAGSTQPHGSTGDIEVLDS